MVRHEAKRADAHRRGLQRLRQNPDESGIIRVIGKQFLASGRSIQHMINNAAGGMSRLSWHKQRGYTFIPHSSKFGPVPLYPLSRFIRLPGKKTTPELDTVPKSLSYMPLGPAPVCSGF